MSIFGIRKAKGTQDTGEYMRAFEEIKMIRDSLIQLDSVDVNEEVKSIKESIGEELRDIKESIKEQGSNSKIKYDRAEAAVNGIKAIIRIDSAHLSAEIKGIKERATKEEEDYKKERIKGTEEAGATAVSIRTLFAELRNTKQFFKAIEDNLPQFTIFAETKGPLTVDKVFSFGNAGREKSVGYATMNDLRIIGISVSSEKTSGEVRIGVLINGLLIHGCEITMDEREQFIAIGSFTKAPFDAPWGSTINFVSLGNNKTTVNTVAALKLAMVHWDYKINN